MAQTIVEFDKLASEGEERIKKLEEGERVRSGLVLDVETPG